MEVGKKMKFTCKYCNKKYPCGKSLGGHLRAHRTVILSETEEENQANVVKLESFNGGRKNKRDLECESGYGLRENPKKTWRFGDLDCEECGRGFQSMKALCGHMACHSEKEKEIMVMDSQSDTEKSGLKQLRRSRRVRNKSIEVYPMGNGSSSVSGIEQEEEEVAMCLMMLSRDNSAVEFSDNNSAVLEAKSTSVEMKLTMKIGRNGVSKANDFVEMKKPGVGKLKYAENGVSEMVKSDVCADGFRRNGKFKKPKVNYESGFKAFEGELRMSDKLNRKRMEYENKGFHSHWPRACSESICENGENSAETISDSVPLPKLSRGKEQMHWDLYGNAKKRLGPKKGKGHVCPFCFKVFQSGQALGGHKKSHFVAGCEENSMAINYNMPKIPCFIDLNLPAPMEDEAKGFPEFVPW